jgi:hypothetical protein
MYTLKSIAQRASSLGAAVAILVAAVVPAIPAYADALNPLTERSLTLSSSSPGWANTDGSGNSTYAPPNSGANGQKTGNYFDFKVSSAAAVKTMSFQYCTTSAGNCEIPGNDVVRGTDTSTTTDLRVTYPSAAEVGSSDFATVVDSSTGAVKAVPGYTNNNPKYQAGGGTGDPAEAAKNVAGNFIVMYKSGGTWTQSTGWTASAHNVDNGTGVTNNYIVITKTGGETLASDQQVKVLFFATATNYITNPGAGAFFVKINTYNQVFDNTSPVGPDVDLTGLAPATSANVIDGGVTVANVMNQSIQITTKVLETMEFSVGTVDPNTLTSAELAASDYASATHIPCGRVLTRMTPSDAQNVLQLGNQDAESSLETAKAYATHSYWRLSSNSSGGATVYYSGHTLSNTSGDEVAPIGTTAKHSAPGSEQFGLALATTPLSGTTAGTGAGSPNFNTGTYGVNYAQDSDTGKVWENAADNGKTGISSETISDLQATYTGTAPALWSPTDANWDYTNLNKSYHTSRLDPLVPKTNYGGGSGKINGTDSRTDLGTNDELGASDANAAFAFDPLSDTVPRAIASESDQVVDCVTAKMRYVANIAATTPAGIYTTKVNYIAAPQY